MIAPLSPTRLLRYLDDLKVFAHPLPSHYAFECETATREAYATLLAVVLLCEPTIAESQERLFRMLLGSLGLADDEARILERAQHVDRPFLLECATLFNDNGLSLSFMADIAVLLRLAGPLRETQKTLLAEFAAFLRLPETELAVAAEVAAAVLGRGRSDHTFGGAEIDSDTFIVWKEFLGRELTPQHLAAGVDRGLWRVSSVIEMDESWSLANCTVMFSREGRIVTHARAGHDVKVSIDRCVLHGPVVRFAAVQSVQVKNTDVAGHYVADDQMTAFTLDECADAAFSNCTFTTRDARAIWAVRTPLRAHKVHFHECGNAALVGGALAVRRNESRTFASLQTARGTALEITNSRFTDCKALIGGALRADSLHESITSSKFERCTSAAYDDEFQAAGVFVDHAGDCAIAGSTFRDNDVQLGNCWDGAYRTIVHGTSFTNSNVYYYKKTTSNTLLSRCTQESSRSIDVELVPERWWYGY